MHNINDSYKHCAKRKKPGTKVYIIYDSIHIKVWKRQSDSDRTYISRCQRPEIGEKGLTAKDHEETFWYNRNILYHDCGDGCICQNSLNCTLEVGKFSVYITP